MRFGVAKLTINTAGGQFTIEGLSRPVAEEAAAYLQQRVNVKAGYTPEQAEV